MSKWLPTSRAGLAFLFLFLGLVILFFDRQTYRHYAGAEIKGEHKELPAKAGTAVQATIKELRSKLEKSRIGAQRYAVAADKNLFSPERKAWRPPAPKPKPEAGQSKEAPPVAAPTRRDVVLYGTYIAGKQKKAILYFKRFRKGHLRLAEGEEARDGDERAASRPGSPVYKVLKVEARSVVLQDARGREFTIGLYDNKKRRPAKTVNKANIKVEKAVVPKPGAIKTGKSGGRPGTVAGKSTSGSEPVLTARDIRKLSREDKEALVAKGVLKKLSTPFGPVYKRVRKR